MDELVLTRIFYGVRSDPDSTTLGLMPVGGRLLYTLEDRWNDNKVGDSCIPDGTYACRPRRFNRGGYDAIEITNVPGRTHILFHRGNIAKHVQGCIVPGMKVGVLEDPTGVDDQAVIDSTQAFAILMQHFGGKHFTLKIRPFDPLVGTG